ncbi:hypothetical protein EON81_30065, partial [bacterium]
MRNRIALLAALASVVGASGVAYAALRPQEDLKIVRTMVSISNARFGNYWPNPAAKEPNYNTWSW